MSTKRYKRRKDDDAIHRAGMFLKLSKQGNAMTVNQVIQFAGFDETDMNNDAIKRSIYRARDSIQQAEATGSQTTSSNHQTAATQPQPQAASLPIPTIHAGAPTKPKGKMRLTIKQAHGGRKRQAELKQLRDNLFKQACNEFKTECDRKAVAKENGKKLDGFKSAEAICAVINQTYQEQLDGGRIVARTVREYVKDGRMGQPINRRGNKGRLPPDVYGALCGAVKSYAILAQQDGTISSNTRPGLARKVNAVVNSK
ncbi:hypothetical protein SEMRO_2545_G330770.1 [Seminavis robusta]|uniref:Uncharacterized protein n=1 Tax=Seminavis robusta TaxID=568900 RepID=A0A9N8EYS4_9STRA|nr:hypothetical protein SEMRO_2545_G330770.1 [Seminavis robusta]|eukprot:Sro2545_g330770.1 n/a (256) ;mRNA; r:4376-5143